MQKTPGRFQGGMKSIAHMKKLKFLKICKQVVPRLLSSRYQDVFALLVLSCLEGVKIILESLSSASNTNTNTDVFTSVIILVE